MAYTAPVPAVQRDPTAVIGRRIVAFIIDFIIVWAVVIAVGAALAKSYSNAPSDACQILRDQGTSAPTCIQSGSHVYVLDGGQTFTMWFLGFLVWLGNYVLLQGATGATVGKFMLGLRCVNAQGEKCGMGRAFVRSLLLIVDEFFCFLVGLITVNVTHPHQRVGDLLAKTYVVATPDVGVRFVAPMPVAAPTWGQQPPAWGQPQQQPPAWGQPPQPPPAWGQPAAQQPPAYGQPPTQPSPWGAPPPQEPTAWGPPPAAPPPPPPPQQQPPPAAPPSWGTPPESAPPPPPEQAAPPAQPSSGESWWDNAVETDGDDEPKQ